MSKQKNKEKGEREIQKWMCASLLRASVHFMKREPIFSRQGFNMFQVHRVIPWGAQVTFTSDILSFSVTIIYSEMYTLCLYTRLWARANNPKSYAVGMRNAILRNHFKVIPLKLFYYQTLKLGVMNIYDMNIKKMQ